jgi:Tat protein secretion system quality control protein TatD with DNase activity
MKDRDVKKLHREVKTLRRELKQTRKAIAPDKPGLMRRLLGGKAENSAAALNVKDDSAPVEIPRDHLIDPHSVKMEAAMANAGMEATKHTIDQHFDLEWLAKTAMGKSMRPPRFLGDACYSVVDKAGVEYWSQKAKDLEDKEGVLRLEDNAHAFRPAPILAVEAVQKENYRALLDYLGEGRGRLGAVGYGPRSATSTDLASIDVILTDLMNETENLVAIGPVGLDPGFGAHTMTQQKTLLSLQLEIAADFNIPVLAWQKNAGAAFVEMLAPFVEKGGVLIYVGALLDADIINTLQSQSYLAVRAEVADKDAAYCDVIAGWPEDRLLIASGEMAVSSQAHASDWNGPHYLEETLLALCELRKIRNKTAFMHQLNQNFARAFYGLEEEK